MSSDGTKQTAVVSGGFIYTSSDSGVNWTQKTNDAARNWISVAMSSDGTKQTAVVSGGFIYTSSDSGVNWTQILTDDVKNWNSVAMSSDGKIQVAVGNAGLIYISPNSGLFWFKLIQNVTGNNIVHVSINSDVKLITLTTNNNIFYSYYDDSNITSLFFSNINFGLTNSNGLNTTFNKNSVFYCSSSAINKVGFYVKN